MTRQSANADEHSKAPIPELNPMINPLLAQNMGRWAEVYFTNPPEEREQAVQELVRQLEQENKEREALISNSAALSAESNEPTLPCRGCGHENPVSQRFCGACGVSLLAPAGLSLAPIPTAAAETRAEGAWAEAPEVEVNAQSDRGHYFLDERRRQYEPQIEPPTFGSTEPSFSYPYRIFLGLALAIVLGVLGYMGWHKAQSLSQKVLQAPPPAAEQPAAPDPGANSKAEQGANQAAAQPAKAGNPPTEIAKAENPAKETPPSTRTAAPSSAAARETTPDKSGALTRAAKTEKLPSNTNGAEELAMAQRYLSGENGQRDPSQATQWLWKAVAKQNSQATLMLADLYLHGDGIQKNCDQARILLDAAASKGQSGAATRLRNMQTFGCR